MNYEHLAPSQELLAILLLLLILPGPAHHLGVPVAGAIKPGGLSFPYNKRRGCHLSLGMRKDMGIWGLGEEVWGSLSVTGVDLETFQISKEHFPCFYSKTNTAAAVHGLLLHSWLLFLFALSSIHSGRGWGSLMSNSVFGNRFMCFKPCLGNVR